jgi:L-gulonate 3-dehydrogenase
MAEINDVAIVGRGIIGSSWALVFARAGLSVRIWSRGDAEGGATLSAIEASIDALRGTGLEGDAETLGRISVHSDLGETVEGVQFIQESVPEKLELKHEILRAIEASAPPDAIVGSSTSGIMPSTLAQALKRPEQFLVVHPLTPPHLLPITELCVSPHTSEATVAAVTDFMTRVRQRPVRLHAEIPGFALNRILGAMMNECFALIRDGVISPGDIDPLLTEGFGLRWGVIGPLAAMDLNAPGGIGEYLRRYGSIFDLVARSRGADPVLSEAVIENIATVMRGRFDIADAKKRIARRDRAIAELRATRSFI